jgi:alkylation response protein AidB-like acyl-CoA dehydrogenase
MPYSFDPFLDALGSNWYEDDPLLEDLLLHHAAPAGDAEGSPRSPRGRSDLRTWGAEVAGPLRELAETSARPGNLPRLRHFDAYGTRVDEVVLPASTLEALRLVEGREGLGAVDGDPFEFYARAYLYWQNGEAGVACSMGCTDGLVRALEALGDRPEHREAAARVRDSTPERVWHGAQFVTEIQGGSDVPANRVRAVPDGDAFRLHGPKWFCSNVNADYFLVTARPDGAPEDGTGVALFLVPARLDPERPERNGYTIDRLKEKLGTRELATAEVTFAGAPAWPVGPLERGLPNLLRYVLTPSRFACVISAAASLRQAERFAGAYTGFRTAFGRRIVDYPPVRATVERITRARAHALAIVFGLLRGWEADRGSPEARDFRILLSLAKPVLTRRATELLHEAMLLLAGNGIEEAFSPLPRLFRDAVIMEVWEGPHNVLLGQALRDLVRFDVDPHAFAARVAGGAGERGVDEVARALARAMAEAERPEGPPAFDRTAADLVDLWGARLVGEVGGA